jgi:ADP-heptose:LPS heptosyltransferase
MPYCIGRVLIVKPDHIGDICLITSVLSIITNLFPKAIIDILIGERGLPVLENNPYINKRIILNHILFDRRDIPFIRKLFESLINYIRAIKILRKTRYDIALIMTAYPGNFIILSRLGGCKYIVGHSTAGGGFIIDNVVQWKEGKHEVEHFLEVLNPFMNSYNTTIDDIKKIRNDLYFSDENAFIRDLFVKYGLSYGTYVVLHPGAGDRNKMYSIDRWRSIVKFILEKENKLLITGIAKEAIFGEQLTLNADNGIVNLIGQLSLSQLHAVFKHSKAVLTVDTGVAHLAASSGAKTIIVWSGFINPMQYKPLGNNVIIIKKDVECSPCYLRNGCGNKRCMEIEEKFIIDSISKYIL